MLYNYYYETETLSVLVNDLFWMIRNLDVFHNDNQLTIFVNLIYNIQFTILKNIYDD